MNIRTLLLCATMSVPATAQELIHATPLPPATLGELAALPMRESGPRVRHHRRWLPPLQPGLRDFNTAAIEPSASTIAAPPLTTVFLADALRQFYPADSAGAVGPAHIISSNNASVIVHDRSGRVLTRVTQDQFWANGLPAGEYYDPRAEYDPVADRWTLMAINDEQAVAFAVSATADPTGIWYRYTIEEPYVDFSMMAITRDTVIFATTGYDFDVTFLYSVRKEDLYSGKAKMPVTRHLFPSGWAYPVSSRDGHQYVVHAGEPSLRIYDLNRRDWVRTARQPDGWHSAPMRVLPQLGGSGLDGGYGYLEDVAEHDGWIYAVMIRYTGGGGPETITWCRVHVESGQSQWGAIADPAGQAEYAYPSLAVNRFGAMLIAFSTFSERTYVSSAYVYRDFLGRISDVQTIRAGDSPVLTPERWGDYTTTVVDPVDDASFWTAQIHAFRNSWATSWARVEIGPGKRRAARK